MSDSVKLGCDYTGRDFGASYPDACCIDGYLWDMDSCDEPGGFLNEGGNIPCPQCNTLEYLQHEKEESETSVAMQSLNVMITGEHVWLSAVRKAEQCNPVAVEDALRRIGLVQAMLPADNPDGYEVHRYTY